jgi:hypothetical protein
LLVSSIVDSYKKSNHTEAKITKNIHRISLDFSIKKDTKEAATAYLLYPRSQLFDFHQSFEACLVFDRDQSHDTIIRDRDDRPCETFT